MGQLLYGSPPEAFEIDDRALAHIEMVVLAKLRRNESFALSIDSKDGSRTAIWLSPSSTLRFAFGAGATEINRPWLEALMDSANTTAGMRIVEEPIQG